MRRNSAALVTAVLILAPIVAGCTATAPRQTPTATPRAFVPVDFAGTLSGEDDIRIPANAHSAFITVVCSGSNSFSLDGALNSTVGGLNGTCNGGLHRYTMRVGPLRSLNLQLELDKVGTFVVDTRFSSDVYKEDAQLAKQCASVVVVASDAFNAEDGYTRGKVTLPEWHTRIATAAGALKPLSGERPNILTQPLTAVAVALAAPTAAPGAFERGDYESAMSEIRQVCEDNGVATYINAEFGG
ncbi:MAG TPA: hypothetical protein VGF80_08860 [Galbitalea sp.]|jgi:hypothetical protein